MKVNEMQPFVRYVRMQSEGSFYDGWVYPVDHRLFYCISGRGSIAFEDRTFSMEARDLLYWPSNLRYRYLPDREDPFQFLAVNFDFTKGHSSLIDPAEPFVGSMPEGSERFENVSFSDAPELASQIFVPCAADMEADLRKLREEYTRRQVFYEIRCTAILTEILLEIVRSERSDGAAESVEAMRQVLEYIRENAAQPLTNAEVGKRFGYHPNYISALVLRHTGLPLHQYLLHCRIQRGAELLRESDMDIASVSQACGFTGGTYFARLFHREYGIPPTVYRRRYREAKRAQAGHGVTVLQENKAKE